MTQPNRDGSFRIPASRMGEVNLTKDEMTGDVPNRLGQFEALGYEPEQLKIITDRYKIYDYLFEKV